MKKVGIYSFLLVLGMIFSQTFNLKGLDPHLNNLTMICLSYIMIEVGLEFVLDKNNLKSYAFDYLVAMTAAAFPWIFCTIYFVVFVNTNIFEALIISRFAAPTSAGVLFAMLAAAGLGTTWLFKKARILAIFDDLDTIILMIPLQIMIVGFKKEAIFLVLLIAFLFFIAYRYLHELKIPIKRHWFLLYGILVVVTCQIVEHTIHAQFEVLLPAFALGCIIYNPHIEKENSRQAYLEPKGDFSSKLDSIVKLTFMFLVGCSIPKIEIAGLGYGYIVLHVLALTLLSNIGKMFPTLCYRREVTLRERIALSVAMFPRGEVGAGVLLVVIEYGLQAHAITIGAISLDLNLLLTGVFIVTVIKLIEPVRNIRKEKS